MISNMLRFPFSTVNDDIDRWLFPELGSSLSQGSARNSYPPINIGMTNEGVEVYIFAPGMSSDSFELIIERNLLSVSGERKAPNNSDETRSYLEERQRGFFKRVMTLPDDVDTDTAQATYRDGVLHVTIAKRPETQKRHIPVSTQ